MSNEKPDQGPIPGWGQPQPEPQPEPQLEAPAEVPWPVDPSPAEVPWPVETDSPAPSPAGPVSVPPAAEGPAPTPPAPVPPAPGTWGAPPQQQPAPGTWGAPPQQQPPGAWGAPQQPPAGWAPGGPGTPGGPPVGWAPVPVKSGGNGCLKGCLIVGAIGLVLVILGFIAISILGMRFAQDLGVNPDGSVAECPLISSSDVSSVLGGEARAMPLGGLVDATVGQLLDKRVIPQAEDCWITGPTVTGRIARQTGGNTLGDFGSALDAARTGGYFAADVPGLGDQAFCTGMSEAASFGVAVRSGDTIVYVSLINAAITDSTGFEPNADGVIASPETCQLAGEVASRVLR